MTETPLFEHLIEGFGSICVYQGDSLLAALKVEGKEFPVECRLKLDREGRLDDTSRALLRRVLQNDLGLDVNKTTMIELEFASKEFVEKIKSTKTNTILKAGTEIESEALKVLADPGLLYRLEYAITAPGSSDPLIGENDNAITLLLVLVSKGSAEVRGQTAAGKNTLVDHVLSVFPQNLWVKVGGLTDKSLRYLPNNLKILYVAERRGLESGQRGVESTAEYDAKISISEGKISVAVTERDPETHRFVTVFRNVVIDSLIFTSTEVAAPPELENRLHVLYVKDDTQQNARVRDNQLWLATIPPWQREDVSTARLIAQAALRKILEEAPEEVIIPFAPALAPLLSERSSIVRRNAPKLLSLIKACARIHYKQRATIQGPNKEVVIAAEPLDLAIVLYTCMRTLRAALAIMPEKASLVLEICKELDRAKLPITVENILLNAGERPVGAKRTVRAAVRYLGENGILVETNERQGKLKVYELQPTNQFVNFDITQILQKAYQEYEKWLSGNTISLSMPYAAKESGQDFAADSQNAVKIAAILKNEPKLSSDNTSSSGESENAANFAAFGKNTANLSSVGFTAYGSQSDIGISSSIRSVPDLPGLRANELCPPWLTSEQWEKLSPEERKQAWKNVPRREP